MCHFAIIFVHFALVASCIHCLVTSSSTTDVIVRTPLGKIRGRRRIDKIPNLGIGTDMVDVFLGVPYAEPPTGENRFRSPKAKQSWSGILNATNRPPACPQTDRTWICDEDCLYLNIYSPFQAERTGTSYPVMVYIHGGSYIAGTANSYTGHILARHGVVVVIINYRLNIFGFLSTGDDELPGNYGILDQTKALSWIQDNIQSFRGDPGQVTIFGNSAGGSSVGVHLLSPLSAGLFHRAIIQSGPITNTIWAHHHQIAPAVLRNYTQEIARQVDCTDKFRFVECMRKVSWRKLLEAKRPKLHETPETLMPVVDNMVLLDEVETLLGKGKIHNVPVLIGMTRDECAFLLPYLVDPEKKDDIDLAKGLDDHSFHKSVEYLVSKRYGFQNDSHLFDDVKFQYTDHTLGPHGNKKVSNRYQLAQICTDVQITAPTIALADTLSNHSLPVYQYVFDHAVPGVKVSATYAANASFHQLDLPFVFGAPYFRSTDKLFPCEMTFNQDDKTISMFMMKYWTNFAKTGNPTPNDLEEDWITWSRYSQNESNYLFFGPYGLAMYKNYKSRKVAFWNNFVPYMSNKLKRTAASVSNMNVKTLERELIAVSAISATLCVIIVVLSILLYKSRRKAKWKLKKPTNNKNFLKLSLKMPETNNTHF